MRAILIIALSFTVGCIAAQPLTPKVTAPAPGAPTVVVLLSSKNRLYDGPVAAFENQIKETATVYETVVGDQRGLADALRDLHPSLVLAFGTQAALFARQNLPETPLLFAMVVNHRRLKELQAPEVMGIALEVPPLSEFTQFKLALPTMGRILAVYDPDHSSDVIADATESARTLGMMLVAAPAHDKDELESQYKRYSGQFDAVWLLNDPVVMNPKAFAFLRDATTRDHVALVSSLSDQFARAGAMMSVSVDFNSLGFQASAMALSLLDGKQTPTAIGIQPPIGARLVLNMVTAQKLGLQVPEEVLPFISPRSLSLSAPSPNSTSRSTSLRTKLVLMVVSLVVVVVVAISAFFIVRHQRDLSEAMTARTAAMKTVVAKKGISLARNVAMASERAISVLVYLFLTYVLNTTLKNDDEIVYGIIQDNERNALVHTDPALAGHVLDRDIDKQAAAADEATTFEVPGQHLLEAVSPIYVGGKRWGTIRLGMSLKRVEAEIASYQETGKRQLNISLIVTIAVSLVLIIVASVVGATFASRTVKPLRSLLESVNQIREGNFDQDADVGGSTELLQLSTGFNAMRETIKDRDAKLRQNLDDLKSRLREGRRGVAYEERISRQHLA